MPKISVIIPVYNVEKYLCECIDSVLNQTYSDFEIILIDDGSNDKSPEICDMYKKKDSRVKVIHKDNGGVSSARNIGIENAKSGYIAFVDSDDWILPDYLEHLSSFESDISICGYITMNNNVEELSRTLPEEYHCVADSIDYAQLYRMNLMYMPWAKLFRRDIIIDNNLRFPLNISLGEDTMFVADYLKYVNTVSVHNYAGYIYNKYEGTTSLSYKISYDILDTLVVSRDYTIKILAEISQTASLEVKKNTLLNAAWYMELLVNSDISFKKKKAFLEHYLDNKYIKETLKNPKGFYNSKKIIECFNGVTTQEILNNYTKLYRANKYKFIKRKIYNFFKKVALNNRKVTDVWR